MPTIFATIIKLISELPFRSAPVDTDMIPCEGEDGITYRTTRGDIRTGLSAPGAHASTHQHGGADEVAISTPAANGIVKANSSGKVDAWVSAASTTVPGIVRLGTDGETAADVAVAGSDSRVGKIFALFPDVSPAYVSSVGVASNTGLGFGYFFGTTGLFYGLDATTSVKGVVTLATPSADTTAGHVVQANDARLSDARTPLSHNHAASDITSGTIATARLGSGTANSTTFLRGDQTYAAPTVADATTSTKGIVELATDGESAANVVVQGNDRRLHPCVIKPSDTVRTGTVTPSLDPHLQFPVVSGHKYRFRVVAHFADATAEQGVQVGIDGTATSSITIYQTFIWQLSILALGNADRQSTQGSMSTAADPDGVLYATIDGTITTSSSGVLGLTWAQGLSATGSLTLIAGSTIEFEDLG